MNPIDAAEPPHPGITQLLHDWRAGDATAGDALLAAVYPTLRAIARRQAAGSVGTITPTELVHEAYLRLIGNTDATFAGRRQFYAYTAVLIRRVLVDAWRERSAQKRGGEFERVTLNVADDLPAADDGVNLLDIDRLLDQLAGIDARAAKLAELRFFVGLSIEQAADAAGYSITTAKRDWHFARAWLRDRMQHGGH